MAEGLVVGIFPGSDAKTLEDALSAQQLDLSKIKVVGARPQDDVDSDLEFVDVIQEAEAPTSDSMTEGTGVWDDTGTAVPGIVGRQARLESFTHLQSPHVQYFSGFQIPDDEVANFSDAVTDGRSVVIYPAAGADAATIAAAFRAAGLRNVRSY